MLMAGVWRYKINADWHLFELESTRTHSNHSGEALLIDISGALIVALSDVVVGQGRPQPPNLQPGAASMLLLQAMLKVQ